MVYVDSDFNSRLICQWGICDVNEISCSVCHDDEHFVNTEFDLFSAHTN